MSDTDIGVSKVGLPLFDAAESPAAQVAALLAVVADMPSRINPDHEDYATAVGTFLAGLQIIADDEAGPPDAAAFIGLAVAELGADPDATAYLTLVTLLADAVAAPEGAETAVGMVTEAVGLLGADPTAAESLTLVEAVTDLVTAGQEADLATGLRSIADVLDPP